jgi:phosphoserine phosphatase RsbX
LLLRAGIVGYDLPNTLVALSVKLLPGDLVIMATDGIRYDFSRGASPARSAQQNADTILANYIKDNDDALVVVVKYLGGEI